MGLMQGEHPPHRRKAGFILMIISPSNHIIIRFPAAAQALGNAVGLLTGRDGAMPAGEINIIHRCIGNPRHGIASPQTLNVFRCGVGPLGWTVDAGIAFRTPESALFHVPVQANVRIPCFNKLRDFMAAFFLIDPLEFHIGFIRRVGKRLTAELPVFFRADFAMAEPVGTIGIILADKAGHVQKDAVKIIVRQHLIQDLKSLFALILS